MPVQNRAVGRGLADNNATHKDKRTERGQNQRITRREEMNMKKLFLILAAAVVLSSSCVGIFTLPQLKITAYKLQEEQNLVLMILEKLQKI